MDKLGSVWLYWNSSVGIGTQPVVCVPFPYFHSVIITLSTSKTSVHVGKERLWTLLKQILPTKMSYSANLKNVMSMETGQRSTENQSLAEQELEASKPGPSPHDLAAQLKSSLLAEIGLTESDGPPLPSFRYQTLICALLCLLSYGGSWKFPSHRRKILCNIFV